MKYVCVWRGGEVVQKASQKGLGESSAEVHSEQYENKTSTEDSLEIGEMSHAYN